MIHLHYNSEAQLTIRISNGFDHSDTERIALFLEGSFEDILNIKVIFQVESDLPKEQMELLETFNRNLPNASSILLKYPILEW